MKKGTFFIAIAIAGITILCSYNSFKKTGNSTEGILFFKGTWTDALKKAKKENKMIFLDAYANWCGPCKKMKSNTFSDKSVADFYNKYFINVAKDMENGEGKSLAKIFEVEAYPTLIFLNSNGFIIEKTLGFKDPGAFLKIGKNVLSRSEK
jgi:thiol:disulfide interchange protein